MVQTRLSYTEDEDILNISPDTRSALSTSRGSPAETKRNFVFPLANARLPGGHILGCIGSTRSILRALATWAQEFNYCSRSRDRPVSFVSFVVVYNQSELATICRVQRSQDTAATGWLEYKPKSCGENRHRMPLEPLYKHLANGHSTAPRALATVTAHRCPGSRVSAS